MATEGITLVDGNVEGLKDDHVEEVQIFETDEDIEVNIGEAAAGVDAVAWTNRFVAVSVDFEKPQNPMAAMALEQGEMSVEELKEEGMEFEQINESAILLVGDDNEVGAGLAQVEDSDIEAALDHFEEEFL